MRFMGVRTQKFLNPVCRPGAVVCAVVLVAGCVCFAAEPLDVSDKISPRNSERPARKSTDYIILHTTEGAEKGSLNKVYKRGEAHYFLCRNGHVYRIIDRNKIAFHAGRSMWGGQTNLDNHAVGIEVSGYHNKDITTAQYRALKELLNQLQRIYKIPDHKVLTHSMVAYGAPNRWHRSNHRGRKRCGMLFARRKVRRKLGLHSAPGYDPDVKARRLVVADPYLEKVLYGSFFDQEAAAARFSANDVNIISAGRSAWDIARDQYESSETVYVFPDGSKYNGNMIKDWKKIPPGTRVIVSGDENEEKPEARKMVTESGGHAREFAGEEYGDASTIYLFPTGMVRTGDQIGPGIVSNLPPETIILLGYVYGGYITGSRSAFDVCGERWNFPETLYRIPGGTLVPGDEIDESGIPDGTLVFFRR
ncbi:MAG: N-acetylmuramoyl-L-alanine amidase [Verrucomicrobiota bacterium]